MSTSDEEALAAYIKALDKDFDLSNAQLSKDYYYASLPLCIIDAVFSIGIRYESVQRTVRNWCESQNPVWEIYDRERNRPGRSPQHQLDEFVELLERHDFPYLAEHIFRNKQRTSTRSGILKAEAVYCFAKALLDIGIKTLGDTENTTRNDLARDKVCLIPGQRSGISFDYFLMLAGSDHFVKPDRMLCRFVSAALQRPIEPPEAQALVTRVADRLKQFFPRLTPRLLDYVIWSYQRRLKQLPAARLTTQ